jgi:ABC-type sugar transport system ATPase subunit
VAEIRLRSVSKVFPKSSPLEARTGMRGAGAARSQADRAFAERAAAHTRQEVDLRTATSGDIFALDNVTLTVPDGRTMAVMGPSGCGKSTMLRVIAGLDPTYTGSIYYDDRDMRDVPPKDRFIGMVFQNYALYPHFEGEGNLRFFFRVRKAPDAEADERIRATAEIMGFGFEQLLDRRPGTLSGGQQQRLAIARALVRKPRLFLFDEPLSNLDAKLRAQTRVEIKRLLHRIGITALYVTHDQEEAVALGDLIAVMRDGRVEQTATYQALRDEPVNAFVAGFLGTRPMNLLEGAISEEGTLRIQGSAVALPQSIREQRAAGQRLILGARPEAGRVDRAGESAVGDAAFSGEIEAIEPDFVRRTQVLRVRTGDDAFSVSLPIEDGWRTGETIPVLFPAEALYFFDDRTGSRIV